MVATIHLAPTAPSTPSLRIQARRRLITLTCITLAIVLAPVLFGVVGTIQGSETSTITPAVAAPGAAAAANSYVVQPGDTLWSVAKKVAPGHDVRATVDRLVSLNGSAALRVGQRLRIDDGG
jgi:hypothetical protein